MPISYLGQYDDNQRIISKVDAIAQQLPNLARGNDVGTLVGGVRSDVGNVGSKIDAIAQQIPNLATGNQQAILIGGVATQANNIYADTQALRNNDIPRLATGNQANGISTSIATLRTETGNIPRTNHTTAIANAASQAASANAGIQTLRSEQATRFNNLDSGIVTLQGQVSGLTSSNGTASSVVILNTTNLIVPYSVNNFARDLIYCLGATEGGYSSVAPTVIEVTANSTEGGDPNQLLNKNSSGWYSTNVSGRFLTFDFGKNKTNRSIIITGLGFQGSQSGAIGSPVSLIISGSNDGTNFTPIQTWTGLGITAVYQWKFLSFSNSVAYRYIRIAQSGLNNASTNYFSCASLNFYGTINNP